MFVVTTQDGEVVGLIKDATAITQGIVSAAAHIANDVQQDQYDMVMGVRVETMCSEVEANEGYLAHVSYKLSPAETYIVTLCELVI